MTQAMDPAIRVDAEEAMLRLRRGSSWRVLLSVGSAGAVMVAMAASHTPWWALAGWYALLLISQAVRIRVERFASITGAAHPLNRRIAWMGWAALASGTVQAATLFFFGQEDPVEQALHTLILLVMCAGAVVYTAGYPRTYYPYMIPIVLAVALAWWTVSSAAVGQPWLAFAVGALILAYGVTLVDGARDTWAMFLSAAAMRHHEARQSHQLALAVQEAQAASHAKTRFLAAASHDLRQPIHTIALLAGVLKLRHRHDASTEVVALLDSVVQSLSHQLDDLLDISKLDAGVVEVAAQPLALSRFLRRRLDEFASEAQAKGLRLEFKADLGEGDEIRACTDPNLLERVLRNLLGNAVKFTHSGHVRLQLERDGTQAVIRVADSGCGIAPEHQREVFQEFVQLNNPERDRTKGMGLGLSIVDRLCKLLAIDLQLSSTPGQGTEFELRLPLAPTPIRAPGTTPGLVQPNVRGMTVLVVDDESMVRQATAWLLSELGCHCLAAEDRASAMATAAAQRPDLALVDHRLRDGDNGVAVVLALRQQHPGMPAVIVSGDIGPQQLQAVESAGLKLLHKPLSAQALLVELQQVQGASDRSRGRGGRHGPG